MSIKQEFKDFIMRGNVIDLAVGMVVGTAFSGIVKSLVDDVIMPPIGIVLGGIDFSNLFLTLKHGKTADMVAFGILPFSRDAGATFRPQRPIGITLNVRCSIGIMPIHIYQNDLIHADCDR